MTAIVCNGSNTSTALGVFMPASRDPNRWPILQIWVIGAIVPLVLAWRATVGKYDFNALWIAGRQALEGNAANIYSEAAAQVYADQFTYGWGSIFPYPPHALFVFIPFSLPPYWPAYFLWSLATAPFFWWAAKPYLPKGFPSVLVILTPAALVCMSYGQTGLLFGALWLLAFRGKWAAVALLTFKPHLGLLSALSLRSGANVLRTAALVLGLVAVSALIFGPSLWSAFAEHTISHAGRMDSSPKWQHAGVSPAMGFGFWGWIPYAAGGALLLARRVNAFTAATASFLISPYGFHYDMPVACLGFGLLLYSNWAKMPFRHRLPIALGFISPVVAVLGVWFVCPIMFWALWVQVQYGTGAFDGARTAAKGASDLPCDNGTLEGARLLR
jgi:hypothetical protein